MAISIHRDDISSLLMEDIPRRSREEIYSSILGIAIGAFDLFIIRKYGSILGFQTEYLIVLVTLLIAIISLMLWGHYSVRYSITEEKITIYQSIGREEINFNDISRFYTTKLGIPHRILWSLVPTFTVGNGIMLELREKKKVFISPEKKDAFMNLIHERLSGINNANEESQGALSADG